jgi:uncharacterized SAM-binding protein YcdF (DUF218 family)
MAFGILAAGLVLGTITLAFLRPVTLYRLVTPLVVVDDVLETADFIYVLNGRISTRADEAARVYLEGLAPRVRLAHTREMARRPDRPLSDLIASEIVERGVPDSAVATIPYPGGVVNTRDEGRALRIYLRSHPADRVIVVTTDHHTGRARRTLRQELRGMRVELLMAPSPDGRGIDPDNWWMTEDGRRTYGTELVKQIGAIVQHLTGTG